MALHPVTARPAPAAIQLAQQHRIPHNLSCPDQAAHSRLTRGPDPFANSVRQITGLTPPPSIDNRKLLAYRNCTDAVRDRLLWSIHDNALSARAALPKGNPMDPQLTRVKAQAQRLTDELFSAQNGPEGDLDRLRSRIDTFVRANLTLVGERSR